MLTLDNLLNLQPELWTPIKFYFYFYYMIKKNIKINLLST